MYTYNISEYIKEKNMKSNSMSELSVLKLKDMDWSIVIFGSNFILTSK